MGGPRRVGALVVALALVAVGCGNRTAPPEQPAAPPVRVVAPVDRAEPRPVRSVPEPNVVLVVMDDVSTELLATMRHAQRMVRAGASYDRSYVVDSLCCVSRASLLTGQYPHQTGVRTNTANTPNPVGPLGGWEAFEAHGNLTRSVNVRLQRAGWETGFVGKFLNQYEYVPGGPLPPVPPGWSSWQPVFGTAYDGWDFDVMTADAAGTRVEHVAAPPAWAGEEEKDAAYAGTVVADRALAFIREHEAGTAPYLLTVAPYAAHSRTTPEPHYPGDPVFPPAFADRPTATRPGNCGLVRCADLDARDLPGWGDDQADNAPVRADGTPATQWRPVLGAPDHRRGTAALRSRAQMVQSVDRMLGRILDAVGPDTYVVLTSDNGFHLGQHGLGAGKGTAFDSDVRVPLVVTGPAVRPGERRGLVSNLDLAPTLEQLAGLRPAAYRAGESLLPDLVSPSREGRRFTFHEHTWAPSLGLDPDAAYAGGTMDDIPSYVAVRSRQALLVRYDLDPSWEGVDHAWELYDLADGGWERRNSYAAPGNRRLVARLTDRLVRFDACGSVSGDAAVPAGCRGLTR
jgi:N-acetylglucosamine-6-sulfatase